MTTTRIRRIRADLLGRLRRLPRLLGFFALTFLAVDAAATRHGPAIAVAAPLIVYLALVVYLARRRTRRRGTHR